MIAQLDMRIKAVCPIHGVSIGTWDDRKTWSIDFMDEATKEQRDAALAVLQAFDPSAPENKPSPPRDPLAELDAIKDALVKKAIVTRAEIEASKAGSGDKAI